MIVLPRVCRHVPRQHVAHVRLKGINHGSSVTVFRPRVRSPCFLSTTSDTLATTTGNEDVVSAALERISSTSSFPANSKMTETTRRLAHDMLLEDSSDENNKDENSALLWKRRRALAQAITLVESRHPVQQEQAALLLTTVLQSSVASKRQKESFRIGIAGAPGAGKSTFIEALGSYVLGLSGGSRDEDNSSAPDRISNNTNSKSNNGTDVDGSSSSPWTPKQLAVVCVDPSSTVSGGSILGDKTRMDWLSRQPAAYVRPAPAAGSLGGLATHTDDVISCCQAAGYSLVILETVGLGQSEVEVLQSVDMLILMVPPAGGDQLQAFKKGIVEVSDLLIVTKADGTLLPAAKTTAADYNAAMQFLNNVTAGRCRGDGGGGGGAWDRTPVLTISSTTGDGLDVVWNHISDFRRQSIRSGSLETERKRQRRYWMWKNLQQLVKEQTRHNPELQRIAQSLQYQLDGGQMTPRIAAAHLLDSLVMK